MAMDTNRSALRRRFAGVAVGLALSAPLAAAAASPASAAQQVPTPVTTAQASAAAASSFNLPWHGSSALIRTNFWSPTHICVTNVGYGAGSARLTYVGGSTPLSVAPGQTKCDSGRYWGTPVLVTNTGYSPLRGTSR